MEPVIRLKDFIQEMDVLGDEIKVYLNIRTGEFTMVSNDDLSAAEENEDIEDYPEWQQKNIQEVREVLSTDDYRELPSKFDIHEYSIMERFCYSVDDDELSDRLLNSIRRRGAFRYFKDTIHEYGIAEDWYKFREQAFKKIAIDWLKSNNIPYIESLFYHKF